MANPKNWNDSNPAAPSHAVNLHFQAETPDPNPNVIRDASVYVNEASSTEAGVVPNLTGHSGKLVAVKSDESALEFVDSGGGSAFAGINIQTGTSYTYLNADKGKLVHHANASAIAGTLHAAEPYDANWYLWVENKGAGTLTITPDSGTIEGVSTLVLLAGEGAFIAWDGSNYYVERGAGPTNVEVQSNKDVANGYAGLDSGGLLKPTEFPTPTTSTFGGVKDVAAVTSKFVTSIVNGLAQLAFALLSGLSDVLITTPADGDVFSYESASSKWKNKAASALSGINATSIRSKNVTNVTPLKGQELRYDGTNWSPLFPEPTKHQWMAAGSATGSTDAFLAILLKTSSITNGPTFVGPSATEPGSYEFSTTAAANTSSNLGEAGVGSTAANITLGVLRVWRCRVRLLQTTNLRAWFGIFSALGINMRTDTPAAAYAAFRFSTAAGDAKWQCVTATDATHQTVTPESTSSHVDTGYHTFEITFDGSNVNFFIDGTLVGSQITNAPTTSTLLACVFNLDNANTASDQKMHLMFFGYSNNMFD